jgi:hypothetical protein
MVRVERDQRWRALCGVERGYDEAAKGSWDDEAEVTAGWLELMA